MTGVEIFRAAAPELLALARASDHRVGIQTRQAVRALAHYDCPLGLRLADAWVGVLARKLESPNRFRAHWSLQNGSRERWERDLRTWICRTLGVASWEGLAALGRRPACTEQMALQIVRLVPSSREFIRDDDNLAFSRKGLSDAMKRTGLLKDDRREWLAAAPILQDVSPSPPTSFTVFVLWPAAAGRSLGVPPHADRPAHTAAHRESPTDDRGTEERRTVPGVRRRAGPRAIDV